MRNDLPNVNQLKWRCRRGIKEVELLLIPYFDTFFITSSEKNKWLFVDLLEEDDVVLFEWFTQRSTPNIPEIAQLVDTIIHRKQPN